MSGETGVILARTVGIRNRWAAWRAGKAPVAPGFVSQSDPKSIGLFAKGKQLLAGNVQLAGHLVRSPGTALWDMAAPDPKFQAEAQGFAWLDDLAAVGDSAARSTAQAWTALWIARFGDGKGPGWTPELTGRRVIRWVHHAPMLLSAKDPAFAAAFYSAISRQTEFLARRWKASAPGLPRFEALTGLVYAGLSLSGMGHHVDSAEQALDEECRSEVDAEGGLTSRNPLELLDIFTLLIWADQALTEADRRRLPNHLAAIDRIAPVLRTLRHSDGGLARFHGGGRGPEGHLDRALVGSGVKPGRALASAMGFARLHAGRTSIVVDAAAPPQGRGAATAHASTAGFELTSGRRPLIVSCGSGLGFDADWQRAARATPSHSTLSIEGTSSSRLGRGAARANLMTDCAKIRDYRHFQGPEGNDLAFSHDGWLSTHGVIASRRLLLRNDGRHLTGEDALAVTSADARRRFERQLARSGSHGLAIAVRFHLHPEVHASLDMGGTAVSLALKSGEIWVFRHDGISRLSLEPSVYLERGRVAPRPTRQIVLARNAVQLDTRIGWTLAKAQDTPLAIRDLDRDDPVKA